MNEAEELFVKECAAHARTLPVHQAVLYLRGMLLLCSDSKALETVGSVYDRLHESENQLDLIHSGQLKLDFTVVETTPVAPVALVEEHPAKIKPKRKGEK